jgi:hypothetical protein
LQSLANFIEPDDVQLLEVAGVSEEAYRDHLLALGKARAWLKEAESVASGGAPVAPAAPLSRILRRSEYQERVKAMGEKLFNDLFPELCQLADAHKHWNPESDWDKHPEHTVEIWQQEVDEDATRQSYVEWVNARIQHALHWPEVKEPSLNAHIPPLVLAALEHVHGIHPEVDRVVFWDDMTWCYMTYAHTLPDFDPGVDRSILDAAARSLEAFPVAFQMQFEEKGVSGAQA